MKRYGYAFIKHPTHYGEKRDELQTFLDEANERGYEIVSVVEQNGYLTIIYDEVYTTPPEQRE